MRFHLRLQLILLLSLAVLASSAESRETRLEQDLADLKRVEDTNSKILAETVQNATAMRQEIQSMKGSIEEVQHFFQEGSEKNEKFLRDFDMRVTGMEERLSLYESQLKEFLSKGQPIATRKGQKENDEDVLYRRALTEINLQNYKAAGQLFDQFMLKFSKSSMGPNAQYWKGETFYALRDYRNAILEFQKVVKKFPKSEKAPGAVLKQGYSFYEMKDYPVAKTFLKLVVSQYPKSEESGQARERIQKIDQLLAKPPITSVPPPVTQPAQPVQP